MRRSAPVDDALGIRELVFVRVLHHLDQAQLHIALGHEIVQV